MKPAHIVIKILQYSLNKDMYIAVYVNKTQQLSKSRAYT